MISVYFTCSDEAEARKIARTLVAEKLAACVNIVPGIVSVYFWKGKICEEKECLALVKTRKLLAGEVMRRIKELHSYETPAILALSVSQADPDYLNWLFDSTKKEGKGPGKIRSKNSHRRKNGRKNPARPSRA